MLESLEDTIEELGIKTAQPEAAITDDPASAENTVSQELETKTQEPEDVIGNVINDEEDTGENLVSVLSGGRPDDLDEEEDYQPFESDGFEIRVSETGEVAAGCPGGSHESCIHGGCGGVEEVLVSYRLCVEACLIRCKGTVHT